MQIVQVSLGISEGVAGGWSREMIDGLRLPISLGSWSPSTWDSVVSCVLVEDSLSESSIDRKSVV